ncbi:MAG: phosphate-starvation-inducible PsiE family protein [Desulforhopalus sp.]
MIEKTGKMLIRAEDFIYIFTAVILIAAAIMLLCFSTYDFFTHFRGNLTKELSKLLDGLLLVMMMVEILHTVGIMIKEHKLVIEPFLAVGIIAAIRRILIITAEQVHPTPEHAAAFKMTMYELGLLSGMILALVLCIFLLRRHGRDAPVKMES